MEKSTLIYCIKNDRVLLAMKKRGFGSGKWNGYGGKVKINESPTTAAIRELEEESGLIGEENKLTQTALIHFYFDEIPAFECYVYFIHAWKNEPVETEEMRPQWYSLANLPFEEMWAADATWLPLILRGEKIEAEVNFSADGTVVKEFSYTPAEFN